MSIEDIPSEKYLVKLKSREYLEEHGHVTVLRLMHRYPDIGSGHIICEKLVNRNKECLYFYKFGNRSLKIHDYMIDEIYTFEEGKKLFPQCYI